MIGNTELSRRARFLWILGAMGLGLASQYCVNYGVCAAAFQANALALEGKALPA